jgi:hypothetical protein
MDSDDDEDFVLEVKCLDDGLTTHVNPNDSGLARISDKEKMRIRNGVVLGEKLLMDKLKELDGRSSVQPGSEEAEGEEARRLLLRLYANPEKQSGLYCYAKALEAIESGLNGGFYYKHFCLASNVIGTGAKGTMKKSVLALRGMYERALFPNLDMTRSELGKIIDNDLAQNKGRIMDKITEAHNGMLSKSGNSSLGSLASSSGDDEPIFSNKNEDQKETKEEFFDANLDSEATTQSPEHDLNMGENTNPPPGCPFHVPDADIGSPAVREKSSSTSPPSPSPKNFDAIRRR